MDKGHFGKLTPVVLPVVIEYATMDNGVPMLHRTPFSDLPDWVRTLLWAEWDHPGDCECHPCWLRKENANG